MNNELTWRTICEALAEGEASVGNGGIYYNGRVYRPTYDRKGIEAWDSKKVAWVKIG